VGKVYSNYFVIVFIYIRFKCSFTALILIEFGFPPPISKLGILPPYFE